MTALQAAGAPDDVQFVARVAYYIVKAAVAVTNEAQNTPRRHERARLAAQILDDPFGMAKRFALAVMSNATLFAAASFAAIPDGDLEFVVNSLYNSLLR